MKLSEVTNAPQRMKLSEVTAAAQQPPPPNTDPQLQVDSGWQEFGNIITGLPQNARAGLAEAGNAVGRSMAQAVDFVGPGTANAALRLAGSDYQLPTAEGGFNEIPGSQGGFVAPGTGRDMLRGYWSATPATLGMAPVNGRNLSSPIGALMEFVGLGTQSPASNIAPIAFGGDIPLRAQPPATAPATRLTDLLPGRQERNALVQAGSESVNRAGYVIDPATGRAVKDVAGRATLKQGFDPGFVSMVETANDATKAKLAQMLKNQERGREFLRDKSTQRASNVLGDSVLTRYQIVRDANRSAGEKMDDLFESLKGEFVDVAPAVNEFRRKLGKMGVNLTAEGVDELFKGSDIEGLSGIINGLKRVFERMAKTRSPGAMSRLGDTGTMVDAYDVHRLKGYLDETLTYGKAAEGLSGKTERALKELRHDLDGILDQQFPAYNAVNSQYAETIQGINAIQDVAGKKMDLTGPNADKALGTLMRRWASNAQSRVPLIDATTELDRLAKKYTAGTGKQMVPFRPGISRQVPDVSDDIETQVQFLSQLEKKFGSAADNSFLGDIGKANDRMAETAIDTLANPTLTGIGIRGLKGGYHWMRGINEENALIALNDLLKTKK